MPASVTVAAFVLAVIWNPAVWFEDTVRPLLVVPVGVPLEGSIAVEMVAAPVDVIATAFATVKVTFWVALVAASDTCALSNVAARTLPGIHANFRFMGSESFLFCLQRCGTRRARDPGIHSLARGIQGSVT